MLAIKFKRIGRKHEPHYRIVVGEKRSKVLGEPLEDLGWYNPKDKKNELNSLRIKYWMGVGAKPTASINNLFIKEKIITGKKIAVHGKFKAPEVVAEPEAKTVQVPPETKTE